MEALNPGHSLRRPESLRFIAIGNLRVLLRKSLPPIKWVVPWFLIPGIGIIQTLRILHPEPQAFTSRPSSRLQGRSPGWGVQLSLPHHRNSQGSFRDHEQFWWMGLRNDRHSYLRGFDHCCCHQVLGKHPPRLCEKSCDLLPPLAIRLQTEADADVFGREPPSWSPHGFSTSLLERKGSHFLSKTGVQPHSAGCLVAVPRLPRPRCERGLVMDTWTLSISGRQKGRIGIQTHLTNRPSIRGYLP